MTRSLTINGVERSDVIRLPESRAVSSGFNGEPGTGSLVVDDVPAALSFPALKLVRWTEDASGSDKHLFRGRVIRKAFSRGGDLADDSRQILVDISDSNWDLHRLRVHQWVRGEESARDRVVALGAYILNGSSSTVTNARKRPSTTIDVTTYVPNTNVEFVGNRVYDSTDPWSVIDDCARTEGKTFFVFTNDSGNMFLWYDVPTSTSYASTLSITDDDPDLVTEFPPEPDGTPGEEDGSELLSGANLVDSTGVSYAQNRTGIETAFDVAEDSIYDSGAGLTDATARLDAFLDEREVEELRYSCSVLLPDEQAHLIKAGMTISLRWAAAGVTSPITVRVVRCGVELVTPELYRLHLELAFPKKVGARIQDRGKGEVIANVAANGVDATFTVGADLGVQYYATHQDEGGEVAAWGGAVANGVAIHGCDLVGASADPVCQVSPPKYLWFTERVYYSGLRINGGANLPADSSYVGVQMAFTSNWDTHSQGIHGGISGIDSLTFGPVHVSALLGNTFTTGDVSGGNLVGVFNGKLPDQDVTIVIPSGMCPWGAAPRWVFAPMFRLASKVVCEGFYGDTLFGSGKLRDASLKVISIATPGWMTAGIIGTRNGSNHDFTLVGGWGDVESVTVNGVDLPLNEVDLTGGTPNITFLTYAPAATDLVLVRYRSISTT